MKTQSFFRGRSRTLTLSLIAGLFFSFNGYSQDETQKDCACVKQIQNGPVITLLNVSEYSETHSNYKMLTDCVDGENCDAECSWAYLPAHSGPNGWVVEIGKCMAWPDVQPVDGAKSNLNVQTELVPDNLQQFEFYPNPASETIKIKTTSESITVIIYDITGAEMMRSNEKTLDVSKLSSGTYIISITDGVVLQREQLVIE